MGLNPFYFLFSNTIDILENGGCQYLIDFTLETNQYKT